MTTEEYLQTLGTPEEVEVVTEETQEEGTEETQVESTEETTEVTEQTEETQEEEVTAEEELAIEKQLAIASKLFGREFLTVEEVEAFKTRFSGLETGSKQVDLIPKLLEKLKASQNILSYFPDENAYRAAQLSKLEDYKGKESIINKVLNSNVAELPSLEVIELQARLDAPKGIRNPFRAKLANLGFDPDSVMEGYEGLSEDDKDRIDLLASESRKSLARLGADIELPKSDDSDVLSEMEAELSRAREDQSAKRSSLAPIAEAIVSELKQIEIEDGFNFKLDLSKEDRTELTEFITNAVLSGDYDLSTESGKKEMWTAVQDLVFLNNKAKILPLLSKHIREDEQRKYRQKSNNAIPINKNEPAPAKITSPTLSANAFLAQEMIDERK